MKGLPGLSWFQRGVRPAGWKDQRHTVVYLFGAVCPERDAAQETLGAYASLLPTDRVNAVILGYAPVAETIVEEVLRGGHLLVPRL